MVDYSCQLLPIARMFSALSYRPQDSAAGREGWRSQTEGEKRRDDWAELAPDQAAQGFPCHGGRGGSAAFHFYSSNFHVTHRFFVTFFTEESNVPLRSLRPLRHKKSETPIATQHRNKSLAISSRSGPCGRALTPSVAAKPPATPSYRAGVRNFASSPAWIAASPAAAAARAPCP